MARSPKPKTSHTTRPRKPRLSQAEATTRMISATSRLLVQTPPGQVTVQKIADAAGVHHDYVARYFGSREELLCQAVESAFIGVYLQMDNDARTGMNSILSGDSDLLELAQVRIRTIAYLLGCGVSPERFVATQQLLIESLLSSSEVDGVSERTRRNLLLVGILVSQGMSAFSGINNLSDRDKGDILKFISRFGTMAKDVETTMKWGPAGRKSR